MRIGSSSIGMESERTYSSISGRRTKITITNKRQAVSDGTGSLDGDLLHKGENGEAPQTKEKSSKDYLNETLEEMRAKAESFRSGRLKNTDADEAVRQLNDIRQQCLNFLMDILFPVRRESHYLGGESAFENSSTTQSLTSAMGMGQKTIVFSRQYYYAETENTTFTTQGTVKCADGREINFNLNLEMSRSFEEYYEEAYFMKTASLCDPLVINLDGNIAELSDQTFLFDIDGDGKKDTINKLGSGSGYLALDKNGDGVINDGTELFGTNSGNGFADLAAYDSDGNGFIDEADEIWDKLKIWIMDENGNQQLVSLADKGIGAICLKNAETNFAIKNQENDLKGMVRNTGFFLYENGAAGSVQQMDLVKYDQAV